LRPSCAPPLNHLVPVFSYEKALNIKKIKINIKIKTKIKIKIEGLGLGQRRLDSRPQSIMGIERLIARVASLSVDC
jgi:hypothetical protein